MIQDQSKLLIRDAGDTDLREIETLLLTSFPELFANACRGSDPSTVIDVLVALRQLSTRPLEGTLVAEVGGRIVGTIRLQPNVERVSLLSKLAQLRPLGVRGAIRFAAFVRASTVKYSPAPDEAYMRSACVAADQHGRGVGAELLLRLVDQAGRLGYTRASCVIRATNTASIMMVHKVGFSEVGELPVPLIRRFGTAPVELIFGRPTT